MNRVVIDEQLLSDILGDALGEQCDISSRHGEEEPPYRCARHKWSGEQRCPVSRARAALHGRKITEHPGRVHLDRLDRVETALADAMDMVAMATREARAVNHLTNDGETAYDPLPAPPARRWACGRCGAALYPIRANDLTELGMACRCYEAEGDTPVIELLEDTQ